MFSAAHATLTKSSKRGRERQVASLPNPRSVPALYSDAFKKVYSPTTGEPKSSEKEFKPPFFPCISQWRGEKGGGRGREAEIQMTDALWPRLFQALTQCHTFKNVCRDHVHNIISSSFSKALTRSTSCHFVALFRIFKTNSAIV